MKRRYLAIATGEPQLPRETDADYCRRLGWQVGDRIRRVSRYGNILAEITAIGEMHILAKTVEVSGEPAAEPTAEILWNLRTGHHQLDAERRA